MAAAICWSFPTAGNQAALEKLVASKPKFSDMFETAAPTNTMANFCPAGFKATNTPVSPYLTTGPDGKSFYIECLKIKVRQRCHDAFCAFLAVAPAVPLQLLLLCCWSRTANHSAAAGSKSRGTLLSVS
jgi:hypothetical protein